MITKEQIQNLSQDEVQEVLCMLIRYNKAIIPNWFFAEHVSILINIEMDKWKWEKLCEHFQIGSGIQDATSETFKEFLYNEDIDFLKYSKGEIRKVKIDEALGD